MIPWILSMPFRFMLTVLKFITANQFEQAETPEEAARYYVEKYERSFGTSHVPLELTSYSTALNEAKKGLRFLLVILTSRPHDETPSFQRSLTNETLRTFVSENDISVWAGDVVQSEAYQVSRVLKARSYPFIALIVYDVQRSSAMSCLARVEGLVTPRDIIASLSAVLDAYNPSLVALRADRREHTLSRDIRAEQDSAYEASLRKDQQRAQTAERERLAREDSAKATREKEKNERQWRFWKAREFPAELGPGNKCSRISFRMPNGNRVVRKFATSTTMEHLYIFADLTLHPVDSEAKEDAPAAEYQHSYNFKLAIPLPRRILAIDNQKLVDNKDLFPSGNLIVEEIVDEGTIHA